MIKNVLIDLDDTILDFKTAEANALSHTLSYFGISASEQLIKTYSAINKRQWKKLELGLASRYEILTERFRLFFDEIGLLANPKDARTRYETNLSVEGAMIDGALPLIEGLSQKYYLIFVSNGTAAIQTRRLAAAGISRYVERLYLSETLGYNKPSVRFFDICFSRIKDFKKEETIIIGDSPTSDILGGINAGIKTCRYNPEAEPNPDGIIPDYEVAHLSEILPLLETL